MSMRDLVEPNSYRSMTAPNPTQSSSPTPATAPDFLLFSAPEVEPDPPVVADLEGRYSEYASTEPELGAWGEGVGAKDATKVEYPDVCTPFTV